VDISRLKEKESQVRPGKGRSAVNSQEPRVEVGGGVAFATIGGGNKQLTMEETRGRVKTCPKKTKTYGRA